MTFLHGFFSDDLPSTEAYLGQGIQEWTEKNLRKTAF